MILFLRFLYSVTSKSKSIFKNVACQVLLLINNKYYKSLVNVSFK